MSAVGDALSLIWKFLWVVIASALWMILLIILTIGAGFAAIVSVILLYFT